jgi:hypothetical protein
MDEASRLAQAKVAPKRLKLDQEFPPMRLRAGQKPPAEPPQDPDHPSAPQNFTDQASSVKDQGDWTNLFHFD